jgi:hypothetical protein
VVAVVVVAMFVIVVEKLVNGEVHLKNLLCKLRLLASIPAAACGGSQQKFLPRLLSLAACFEPMWPPNSKHFQRRR